MTLEQISSDLLMREKAKEISISMKNTRIFLPVYQCRTQIVETVAKSPVVLIKGATGCGKSTQVCQYLLEESIKNNHGANFNCFVSQPRRISAITLAERVANERGEIVGNSVGYGVRFDGISPRPYGKFFNIFYIKLLKAL